jgi:cytochrome c oxidase subunit II
MKLLILVSLFLGVLIAVQFLRISKYTAQLKDVSDADSSESDNKLHASLFALFGVGYLSMVVWTVSKYGLMFVRPSASEHGKTIDALLGFNWILLAIPFFLVHGLLFFFVYKYLYNKDRKAYFYSHNNTMEAIWTAVPALALSVIIIWGLVSWNEIMDKPKEDAVSLELYAKQFDWTARYPGADGKLGVTNYNVIANTNPLGIVTVQTVQKKLQELEEEITALRAELENTRAQMSDYKIKKKESKIRHLVLHKNRVLQINLNDERLKWGEDDVLTKVEFHLPIDREASFQFRSRDVIHSALMYDFRAQMNVVPGMATTFKYTPIISTADMRKHVSDAEFHYKLTCNKICGASHWNMTMDIVVESEQDFNNWLAQQKTFQN